MDHNIDIDLDSETLKVARNALRRSFNLSERETKIKDLLLTIKQQRLDISCQKGEVKEQERTLKENTDELMSLLLLEYGDK